MYSVVADDKRTKILRTHLLQECNSENAALELKKKVATKQDQR